MTAVIVNDEWESRVRARLGDLKVALGRHREHRLHFSQLRQERRLPAAQGVAGLPLATITSVIVNKKELGEPGPAGELAFISDPMYLWALRLLLERVSWFVDGRNGQAKVTFSHVQKLAPQEIDEYRKALEAKKDDPAADMRVRWRVFEGHPFHVDSPKKVELLQVADVTASSVWHAVEPGANGPAYLEALSRRLYRGVPPLDRPGDLATYGLKTFP